MDTKPLSHARRLMNCCDICENLQYLTELITIAMELLGQEGDNPKPRTAARVALLLDTYTRLTEPCIEQLRYQLAVLRTPT